MSTSTSVHVLYTATAMATGAGDGHVAVVGGTLDVTIAAPTELGGGGGPGHNPEQLFAAAYAACFMRMIRFVASESGTAVADDMKVIAKVGIGPRSQGGFGLDVLLEVSLPGMAHPDAEALVLKCHLVCPYSHAIRNNVPVRLVVA